MISKQVSAILAFVLSSALIALGAPRAHAEQIYLYDAKDFAGTDFEATFDVPDLAATPIAGKMLSLRARTGVWLLCTEPNYSGNCLWTGHAQIADLTPWGFAGSIRSIRLYRSDGPRSLWPTSLRLTFGDVQRHGLVIADNNSAGDYRKLTDDVPDLAAAGINFRVGAFIITGRPVPRAWQLCTSPNYSGRCLTAVVGNSVMAEVFTDRIASIRQLPLTSPSTDPIFGW